jgi:hypothetical protein
MTASNTVPMCELDKELEEILRGAGPRETRFRLKIREILNDELATFRSELATTMKQELDTFSGALRTELTDLLTKSSLSAARKVKTFVERELLAAQSPPTRDTTH